MFLVCVLHGCERVCEGCVFVLFFFLSMFNTRVFNVYFGKREGDTEPEAGSRLCTDSTEPVEGLKPTNRELMT